MAPDEIEDPVDSRITIVGQIEGVKPAPRRRLPRSTVRWTSGHVPPGPPGAFYRALHAKLVALRLKGLEDDHLRQLAAMMTLAKFLERSLWEFHATREAANAALAAMRRLLNAPLPWPPAQRQEVAAAVAALWEDPVLTVARTAGEVAEGAPASVFPLREGIRNFLAFLDAPGASPWRRMRVWTEDFEDLAARYVGKTTSVFVDLDRVGRFIHPGGSDPQSDVVGQWASWAVTDYIARIRKKRHGAARDAGRAIDQVFPAARGRDEPINVVASAFRAWRNYFGGRRPTNASSPEALWLGDHGGLWRRFEAVP